MWPSKPDVEAFMARIRRDGGPVVFALALLAPIGGVLLSRAQLIEAGGEADRAVRTAEANASEASVISPGWRDEVADPDNHVKFANQFNIPVTLAEKIYRAARAEGVRPEVAFGLVYTESSFRRTVVSYAGAVGYTQLLPSTANWIVPGTSRGELFDTDTNLTVGFRYLRYLLDKYDGDTRLALLAYNRGPGTVDRLLSRGQNPANGYARKVLSAG